MTEGQRAGDDTTGTEWPKSVAEKMKSEGIWPTLEWLQRERSQSPQDLALRGYVEILRASIVKDFLSFPKGMQSVPKMTPDFLNNFDQFNLSAQEGYLISQIDGRTNLEKLLKLSPFDPFNTLFSLARMHNARAIEIPK